MTETTIGSSIVIDGEVSGNEDLTIQGTVKGRILLKDNLYVEQSGTVKADVETSNVTVSGLTPLAKSVSLRESVNSRPLSGSSKSLGFCRCRPTR